MLFVVGLLIGAFIVFFLPSILGSSGSGSGENGAVQVRPATAGKSASAGGNTVMSGTDANSGDATSGFRVSNPDRGSPPAVTPRGTSSTNRGSASNRAIAGAARDRIGVTTKYSSGYVGLKYPGGDVANDTGVCSDLVVRALRATGNDLQQLVHEDMKAAFLEYPQNWGARGPDKSIDHRRVPNLMTYFKRRDCELPLTKDSKNYQPGDIVSCLVGGRRTHIMVVSDKKTAGGVPLIIHNIGNGTEEADQLFSHKLTGHFRFFDR